MKLEVTNTVVRVVEGDDVEKGWLREYLSFDDESRAFRKDRRSGRVERVKPPKIRLFNILDETFPTGLLALVRKRAAVLGHAVELRDVRPAGVPVDPAAELRWLRPYQADALEAAVRRGRGILWLPTGAGKTEVAVGLTRALPTRWLFVVHRAGLMYQAAERYDLRNAEHGIALPPAARFGDGKLELGDRLTVATFQTVRAKLESTVGRELLRRTEGLIVDECFPAGTLVGGVPIESLSTGDLVPSYEDGRIVHRAVGEVFSRRPDGLVRLDFSDGTFEVCTPGHPFLTEEGYLPAETLCGYTVFYGEQDPNNPVFKVWEGPPTDVDSEGTGGLLRRVSNGAEEGTEKEGRGVMCGMRGRDRPRGTPRARPGKAAENVLFQGLSDEGVGEVGPSDGARQYGDASGTDERVQPDERPGGPKEGLSSAERGRRPAEGTRGQRKGADSSSTSAGEGARVVDGSRRKDRCPEVRGPVSLLDRHREPGSQDRDRGRRSVSPSTETTGVRRSEDGVLGGVRVDRVSILEPGGDGTYGGLCPDGLVYNLHVPGPETYLVGLRGLIVHNCHTLPAETFYGVAMSFLGARFRLGLSGTPLDRDDKRSLMAVGALGPVIHRVRTEELVDAGVLAVPRVRMVEVEQDIYRPTYQGVYGEAIVRSTKRNRLLADIVARAASRPAVVFVREVAHGKNLLRYLERAGLRAELVWGNTPEATRTRAKKDLSRGNLDAVVASVVWQEGIDVPELRSVVVAAAGRSTIAALQRAGRGMRRTDEKTSFEIWDLEDRGNAILERHSRARRRAYERENFDVAVITPEEYPSLYEPEELLR